MRILHASTHERLGGAAVAARRLHLGLLAAGADSRLAVAVRQDDTPNTVLVGGKIARRVIRPLALWLERTLPAFFHAKPEHPAHTSFSLQPSLQHRRINAMDRDILHLHWLGEGFVPPWALGRLRGPAVWTIHDTWPFTGGCHYTLSGCERYLERCGRCPELCSRREADLSRLHWNMKRKAVQRLLPVMVSPSRAYAEKAARSGMLRGCRVEHIPHCIDIDVFKPLPKPLARQALNLSPETPVILFGAMDAATDRNKGFDLLCAALALLRDRGERTLQCLVFGAESSESARSPGGAALPFVPRRLGRLGDDISLALAYSAADMFVCPSRVESFSQTTLESMACGTPVVGFSVGGIPDMVEHGVNGYLAAPQNPEELAAGIASLLRDEELRRNMGQAGRKKAEREFSSDVIARRYISLYEDALKTNG